MNKEKDLKTLAENTNAWPFVEARNLRQRLVNSGLIDKKLILFETGYGPSGLPHIGTFGEVARTAMVQYAFETLTGMKTRLICFSDDMDGFRKVPDNVPNQDMLKKYLDFPLTKVPDPFGKYESFGVYNNNKLIEFLKKFNFEFDFVSSTECYKSGAFDNALKKILQNYETIKNIILPTLGNERKATYSPFLPICPITGKVLQVNVTSINVNENSLTYLCPESKKPRTVSILGGSCKLQWKCDWAMRWFALGVDYEMAGKDLSESVILSSKILKALGGKPPTGFSYELFLDSKGEKISKSKGNGLSIEEWLKYGTQESLSLFMYSNPKRAKKLFFDVIPKTIDEYFTHLKNLSDQESSKKLDNPLWYIHQKNASIEYFPVSFNLLLNLASVCHAKNTSVLWKYISNYAPNLKEGLNPKFDELVDLSINYYNERIMPYKKYRKASKTEKIGIKKLIDLLINLSQEANAEEIQTIVFSVGKEMNYENLRDWFSVLYETVLGQSNGPRMGGFIKLYGIDSTISLLNDALNEKFVKDEGK